MDRKIQWLLLLLVLVAAISTLFIFGGKEGFQSGLLPDSAVTTGQARFNKTTDLLNLTQPQVPLGTQPPDSFQKALGSVNVVPTPDTKGGLPGTFAIQGVADSGYKIPAAVPDSLRIAQTVCETVTTPDCGAFANAEFAANCGISFDMKGKDSRGKGHIGGMYISSVDRVNQVQRSTDRGLSPDQVEYTPTYGTSAKGQFAIDASSCAVLSEQVACRRSQSLTSPNCTSCFTNGAYNRVDPSTPRIPATFVIQTNATSLNFVAPTGTTPMTVTADTPLVVAPMPALNEGDLYYFQATGDPANLYLAGYLTAQTAKGTFNLDLNALLDLDTVTNYKPRLGGTQDINSTRCFVFRPGVGQSTMNLRGHLPFSFLSPYEYDAQNCDNGPILTQQASADFLNTDVCYGPKNKPGTYGLPCLQQTFVGMGGTTQGTGYPKDDATAKILLFDEKGVARSLDDIADFLYGINVEAATGLDRQGNQLSITDWNTASMFALGIPITSPCDGPNKDKGPLTAECLQYLYTNGGSGGSIGATYSLGPTFASQDSKGNPVYCTPQGALSPSSDGGLKRGQAAGGVEAVKTLYDTAHRTANDNSLTNQQRAQAMSDCYGDTFDSKGSEVFWVGGGTSNSYTVAPADAAAVCQSFGAQVATPQQLSDAQAAGAQWCSCGWASDGNAYYPMQQANIPGCGAATVNDCGNMAWAQGTAGVSCYGPKPPVGATKGNYTVGAFSTPGALMDRAATIPGSQWNTPYLS